MTIQSIDYSHPSSINSNHSSSSESVRSIEVGGIKPEKFSPSKFEIAITRLEESNQKKNEGMETLDLFESKFKTSTDMRPHMVARSEKSARDSARSSYIDGEEKEERERREMEMRE